MPSPTSQFNAALLVTGLALASVLAPATAGGQADGQDPVALDGETLANKYHCTTCHGRQGKTNDRRYPHIAGQGALYLQSRLEYFRSGAEPGNQMNGQAAPLDDPAIAAIAEWFSRQPR